jgi:hypothetical protein
VTAPNLMKSKELLETEVSKSPIFWPNADASSRHVLARDF